MPDGGAPVWDTFFQITTYYIIFLINEWSPTLDYKGIFLPLNFLSDISVSFGLIVFGFVLGLLFFFNFGGCVCVGFFFFQRIETTWLTHFRHRYKYKQKYVDNDVFCFLLCYIALSGFYNFLFHNMTKFFSNKMQFKI